ncbi:class I SAM-dependent methyltransferase [Halospina sp. K52047b]|uniref:class I SAM-dependent methyltransferase n=1 Tax=Halospina sp. K52047b TaxID=2614160 RepID=UPI00124AD554|nr:class I SAM-dependent methyltransferase [Halospina sp. K52047b]KAA8984292.1 class I SAM-dependent methyltransferase [Halospina sp. K52047b]
MMTEASPALSILERSLDRLGERVCLVGHDGPMPYWQGCRLHALTTHYGVHGHGGGADGGRLFGYDDPETPDAFDTIVILMPKARSELEMRMAWAAARLAAGGELWLVGAKREGIARGSRQFRERFPGAFRIDSARHCQLWCATLETPAAPFRVWDWLEPVTVVAPGADLELYSLPGLFSEGRLDEGTRQLLATVTEKPAEPVLDLACGNGVIAAWLRHQWPELAVTLADVHWQALNCARAFFEGAQGVTIVASDGFAGVTGRYASVFSNPPFHQGQKKNLDPINQWFRALPDFLQPGAELRLVANAFLPYQEPMIRSIGPVRSLSDDGRYRVYSARRNIHGKNVGN